MVAGKIVAGAVVLIVLVAIAGLGIYYYDAYHKLNLPTQKYKFRKCQL